MTVSGDSLKFGGDNRDKNSSSAGGTKDRTQQNGKRQKMNIEIDAQSHLTITEQIIRQIERLIDEGKLKSGDELPAVKEMADRLQISRMTTAKAYALLCSKGIAEQRDGRFIVRVKK